MFYSFYLQKQNYQTTTTFFTTTKSGILIKPKQHKIDNKGGTDFKYNYEIFTLYMLQIQPTWVFKKTIIGSNQTFI